MLLNGTLNRNCLFDKRKRKIIHKNKRKKRMKTKESVLVIFFLSLYLNFLYASFFVDFINITNCYFLFSIVERKTLRKKRTLINFLP